MKQIITLFLLLGATLALSAQDIVVPQTQKSLITKKTADWCSICGNWGWDLFENLVENLDETQGFAIANHYSGGLSNTTTSELQSVFPPSGGQPRFYLNSTDQNVTFSTWMDKEDEILQQVSDAAGQTPTIQTGLELLKNSDGSYRIRARSEFFQDGTGDYSLQLYTVERDFVGFQNQQGPNADHKNLVREALLPGALGLAFIDVSPTVGSELSVEQDFTTDIAEEDLVVLAIVWKSENGTETFVNLNTVDEVSETSNAFDPAALGLQTSVLGNSSAQPVFQLTTERSLTNARVVIYDVIGRQRMLLHQGNLGFGTHSFEIELPSGVYLASIFVEGRLVVAERVSIQ